MIYYYLLLINGGFMIYQVGREDWILAALSLLACLVSAAMLAKDK